MLQGSDLKKSVKNSVNSNVSVKVHYCMNHISA